MFLDKIILHYMDRNKIGTHHYVIHVPTVHIEKVD